MALPPPSRWSMTTGSALRRSSQPSPNLGNTRHHCIYPRLLQEEGLCVTKRTHLPANDVCGADRADRINRPYE